MLCSIEQDCTPSVARGVRCFCHDLMLPIECFVMAEGVPVEVCMQSGATGVTVIFA